MNKKNEKKSATHRYIPVFSVLLFPPEILLAIYRRRKTADEKKACRSLTGFLLFFSCFFFLSLSLSLSLFCMSCVSDHLYLSPLPLCCSVSLSCRTPSSLRTPTHTHTHPLCALLCTTLDLGAREYVPTNQPTNPPKRPPCWRKFVRKWKGGTRIRFFWCRPPRRRSRPIQSPLLPTSRTKRRLLKIENEQETKKTLVAVFLFRLLFCLACSPPTCNRLDL